MSRAPDRLKWLAANIRQLRERRGWTQEQLAEAASLATRYVQTLESPQANPRAGILLAVADALAVDVGRLFKPAVYQAREPGRPYGRPRTGARAPKR
ncbi:MAG: helix-turn-helix transcriptional regulator [Kofleriaceae bacterium]